MKRVTRKLEKEIARLMQDYWDSYFKGDLDTWASYLLTDYKNIGSTQEEIWDNKDEILQYTEQVRSQLDKAEIRNWRIEVMSMDPYLMAHEFGDIFVKSESGWTFYAPFRLSSVLKKHYGKWKVAHQHGSYPDSRTEEGEAFAFDEIMAENKKLQAAVEARTAELEQKSRELEIEAALERVRAVAMGMKEPDDMLDVCQIIAQQLALLGVTDIRNLQTVIIYEESRLYLNYQFFPAYEKTVVEVIAYEKNPVVLEMVQQMQNSRGTFFGSIMKGKRLREFAEYRKKEDQIDDPKLDQAESVHYHFYSIGEGALGMTNYAVIEEVEVEIFKRFCHVFELAYQRFLDIRNAEAQAREARIEVALERVRTQSMLMQHSSELNDISVVFHEQLHGLSIPTEFSYVWLPEETKEEHMFWATWTETSKGKSSTRSKSIIYPLDKSEPYTAACFEAWESDIPVHVIKIPAEETEHFFDTWSELLKGAKKLKARYFPDGIFYAEAYMKYGCFGINIRRSLDADEQDILYRFAIEFERAYTRFLDLKKAEAQAREAQIEAALEKVRSRTMAMQRSEELPEAANNLFVEVQALGIPAWSAGYCIWEEDKTSATACMSSEGVIQKPFSLPTVGVGYDFYTPLMNGEQFHISELGGAKIKKHYEFMHTLPIVGEVLDGIISAGFPLPSFQIFHIVYFPQGYLMFITYEPVPEAHDIFKRFGNVFEQTYTRFLDLQRAETQAREAQIEAALERVRSRTMGMQKSNELPEAANLLFQQLRILGMSAWSAGYCIWDDDKQAITLWMSSEDVLQPALRAPLTEDPIFIHFLEAHQRGETFYVEEMGGEELVAHYQYMRTLPGIGESLDEIIEAGHPLPTFQVMHCAYFSEGFLLFITYEPVPEAHDIFKRFGNVFEQTYTRFLDLQKAEAQAREAQIEAALERVRSRTMAMQHSEELEDVSLELFRQVADLGIETWATGFNVWHDGDMSYDDWVVSSKTGKFMEPYTVDLTTHPFFIEISKARKRGDDFFVIEGEGKELEEHYRLLFSFAKIQFEDILASGFQVPKRQVNHFVFGSRVSLMFITFEPCPDTHDIFQRFGKAFEQTYTRFLDLQKAEAQAREAQIEAALERVRAATMAMHKSDELAGCAQVMFDQLRELGVNVRAAWFSILLEDKRYLRTWLTEVDGTFQQDYLDMLVEEYANGDRLMQAWKDQDPIFLTEWKGKELEKYIDTLATIPAFAGGKSHKIMLQNIDECFYSVQSTFKQGLLGFASYQEPRDEDYLLLPRFAKVFEQTFTRFTDIQKAEAQAHEARIEAALERVRSVSLAMHDSAELQTVISTVFNQLRDLGISMDVSFIEVFDKTKNTNMWVANPKQAYAQLVRIPYFKNPILDRMLEARNKTELFFSDQYGKGVKNRFYRKAFKASDLRVIPEEMQEKILRREGYARSAALSEYAALVMLNLDSQPFTEDDNLILQRFSKVFEQAYVRFLDLEKAEAQAREAQIEAALERVRAASMAMHKTHELANVVEVLFQQFAELQLDFYQVWINIFLLDKGISNCWFSPVDGVITEAYTAVVPLGPFEESSIKSWRAGEEFSYLSWRGRREVNKIMKALSEMTGHDSFKRIQAKKKMDRLEIVDCNHKYGVLAMAKNDDITDDDRTILKRFTKVFEQAYTRFLDLEKSEAQAREAQIEAALERVRAHTMAMRQSSDLATAAAQLFKEVHNLYDLGDHQFRSWIAIADETRERYSIWSTDAVGKPLEWESHLPMQGHPVQKRIYKKWKSGEPFVISRFTAAAASGYTQYLMQFQGYNQDEELKNTVAQLDRSQETSGATKNGEEHVAALYEAFFDHGRIGFMLTENLYDLDMDILVRFARVFEQTFTRFQDLEKAEEQAREAQIEAAMERIRAQAMAMNKSADLLDIVVTMRNEFVGLGHEAHYFWHMRWLPDKYEKAMTSGDGTRIGMIMDLPRHIHGEIELLDNWEKGTEPAVVYAMDTEAAIAYVDKMITLGDFKQIDPNAPSHDDIRHIGGLTFVMARTTHGEIGYSLPGFVANPPAEDLATLVRFAGVFDLAYQRFEDLKIKEQKNRETEIELALERVRSRGIAMHHSDELNEVVNQLFESLDSLGFDNTVCNVSLIDQDTRVTNVWTAHQTKEDLSTYHVRIPDVDHPFYHELISIYVSKTSFSVLELEGDLRQSWSKVLSEVVDYSSAPAAVRKANAQMADSGERIVLSAATMKYGMLIASGSEPISDEEADILQRFSTVFELTYTRFLDLQLAEKQAHQAQIEVALERVRARALAMQQPEELIEVAQVLRQEMGALGVETLETSTIFIYDSETKKAETWFAVRDPEHPEQALVSDHIVMDHTKTQVGREMIRFYNSTNQKISVPMIGKHRAEWVNYAYALSKEFDGFFGDDIPDRIYHLSKFSHGAIGASSVGDISEESWDLLGRAASVFSLAYSRFQDLTQARLDLKLLKEEKQRAEDALVDLKAAQTQLVHSEKMASLGELTAGIAHEIKNPLNFVNNFSEVSHELLDEMKEALTQGDLEDATELAQDVIGNLEKIIHHGKRADGIVRSMLEHSRGSTGEKELTDLNLLADEYLRLAYHGLRAKDKSFNADFKAELDADLPKIQAVPQDIGRVLLNLINNAFYAVSEKKKVSDDDYHPTVVISTAHQNGTVRVKVTDNGNGIPSQVLDKIFQPFFTTKPTGEGTGLGLSMSYDIITKGHDGTMTVETEEGKGTTFFIAIPIIR